MADINKIGIIGAGQMGAGIAQVCAVAGFDVILNDISDERVDHGLATISGNLSRLVERKQIDEAAVRTALAHVSRATDYNALADCDLVIEAATENETIKHAIFQKVSVNLKPGAILATNTSSISITRLAAATDRPEHFIGIHFMNPVPRMQLVELICGIATDDVTFTAAKQLIAKLGKTAIVSEDFPGFIVNRILLPMINEAIYTLYEGVGSVELDRYRSAARRQSPDGTAATCRLHRPRHRAVHHAGFARGAGRFEISPLPAAGKIRGSRLARSQDPTRLLRLSQRYAGADPLERLPESACPARIHRPVMPA